MLKKIFKPKWQHKNAEIRKKAIEALSANEIEILRDLAQTDEQPALRCLAVRKLNDLPTLLSIQQNDGDKTVRDLAAQCSKQLLTGKANEKTTGGVPDISQRLNHLRQMDDNQAYSQEVLGFLARHGQEVELREYCIDHIHNENIFAEVVIYDAVMDVRLRALDKIQQRSALEKITKQTRNKDKKIFRVARERLDALIELEQKPQRLQAERDAVCKQIGLLLKTQDWEKTQGLFEQQQQLWQAIEGDANAQTQQLYDGLCQEFNQSCQQALAEKQQQQALLAQKQQLLDHAHALEKQLDNQDELSSEQNQETQLALDSLHAEWQALAHLPEKQEQQLQLDYKTTCQNITSRQRALRHLALVEKDLEAICTDAEQMLNTKRSFSQQQLKQLHQRWHSIEHPAAYLALISPWLQRFETVYPKLEAKIKTQQGMAKQNQQMLRSVLDELEKTVAEGQLQDLLALEKQAKDLRNKLSHDRSASQKNLNTRLHKVSEQIKKLKSWQSWGNNQERDSLCEQAEALINIGTDPEVLAKDIRTLQAEWKKLTKTDHSNHGWNRFNKACQTAYLPCKLHFEQKAQQRHQHQDQKNVITQQLVDLNNNTDWSHVDWHKTYRDSQKLRHEWYKVGAVDRRNKKKSMAAFQAALDALEVNFDRERKRNLCSREELLAEVKALDKEENLNEAIDKVKVLQKRWKVTVPSKRHIEHQLWDAFSRACDAVFARRKALREQHVHDLQDNLKQKKSVCERLEALLADDSLDIEQLQRQAHKIQSEWHDIGQVPKKSLGSINKRYEKIGKQITQQCKQKQRQQQNKALENLHAYAEICTAVEQQKMDADSAQQAWQNLAEIEADDRKAIEKRFQQSLKTQPDYGKAQQQREILAIRMEILAKVDSPAEAMQQRMAYQVECLSKSMQGEQLNSQQHPQQEAQTVERAWYLCPACTPEINDVLEQRFQTAKQHFYQNKN